MFDANAKALESWDVLGNDAGLPLVGPRIVELLTETASKDVRFIDVEVHANKKPMNGWSLLNPLYALKVIDHDASIFWYTQGTQQIGGFRQLRFTDACLGEHHIARDAEYLAHIVVDMRIKLAFEEAGCRGVEFVPPERLLK